MFAVSGIWMWTDLFFGGGHYLAHYRAPFSLNSGCLCCSQRQYVDINSCSPLSIIQKWPLTGDSSLLLERNLRQGQSGQHDEEGYNNCFFFFPAFKVSLGPLQMCDQLSALPPLPETWWGVGRQRERERDNALLCKLDKSQPWFCFQG